MKKEMQLRMVTKVSERDIKLWRWLTDLWETGVLKNPRPKADVPPAKPRS